ncbi:fructose-bisphosphate aldolase class I [Pararhizobium capsulatum DSM 1112]|uniref:fructose-bisphosphate aldolase n=1 Tax=Pararhizobium capsulatum DSM 1112 TaxID=1121113 RepID=A0ABU0C1V5_9HYPH|nr:fructose bisphosphate aldolase [Pararhizobium capsulatum]MDQ0323934.1 fructose-bisphosphate aldolase class I [Pararhizobium capsulatum DSM 1112]
MNTETRKEMAARLTSTPGIVAALDQSGGSTPETLRSYGISDAAYQGETEMLKLIHEVRVRIMTAPTFSSERVIGAILFEHTMDRSIGAKSIPAYLWEDRGIFSFLKVDSGREAEQDGVQLMKPMPNLSNLLERALEKGVLGTKMRSVVHSASEKGISIAVRQQFDVASTILKNGLIPIIEPEVLVSSPDKVIAEAILVKEILKNLSELAHGTQVILKLTLPSQPDLYAALVEHPKVARVFALSGGYSLKVACEKLRENTGVIGSFSRALFENLRVSMPNAEFDLNLSQNIEEIYLASTQKGENA